MIAETIRNIITLQKLQQSLDPFAQMCIREAIREAEEAISSYDTDLEDPDYNSHIGLLYKNIALEKLIRQYDKKARWNK